MKIPFRKLSIVLAILVLAGSFFMMRWLGSQKQPTQKQPPPQAVKRVNVETVALKPIRSVVPVYGKIEATQRISILAEVQGVLLPQSAKFRAGANYQKGQTLLQINSTEAQLNLTAQRSALQNSLTQLLPDLKLDYPNVFNKWQQWLNNIDPQKPLPNIPDTETDQEKYFITARGVFNQYYQIRSQEARLAKYTLNAPFAGIVTQSNVRPGMLVSPGQVLGEYIGTQYFELTANINSGDLQLIKTGDTANLRAEESQLAAQGTVVRIGGRIDPQTQTVPIYISIKNAQLREGMYLTGQVKSSKTTQGALINRNLLLEGNRVFVVSNNQLAYQTVTPISYRGSQVVVQGLSNGQQLLANRLANAYEGMKVKTNNTP